MKRIIWPLLVGIILAACSHKPDAAPVNESLTVVDEGAKEDGLDLQALGELIKKSASPAKLEETLNKPGSINDLDKDGKVDYLKVTEAKSDSNSRDLKFTDITADSTPTVVADVNISRTAGNQGTMNVAGNQNLYGSSNTYQSGFPLGEVLLMAYLFSPHMPYYSPYHYGAYPGYYRPYAPMPQATYHNTVTHYTSHPIGTVSTPVPSRTLSGATRSQRSFGVRSSSAPAGSGGFGSSHHVGSSSGSSHSFGSSAPHSSYSHSSSSSSHSSSHRSFGGSRRH
jgi:hypothetical protein